MIEYLKALSDLEFESAFESCNMLPSQFTHEAHLRLAWIHINKYGIEVAQRNITSQLLRFVKHLGAEEKYNETVTIAAIKTVNHFMRRSPESSFYELLKAFPRMKNNFKGLLSAHYSFDLFDNSLAKASFLEPDLLPYDQ